MPGDEKVAARGEKGPGESGKEAGK